MEEVRDCQNCIHWKYNEEIQMMMCSAWSCDMKTLDQALEEQKEGAKDEQNH